MKSELKNKRNLPLLRGRVHLLNLVTLPILAVSVIKNHSESQIVVAYFIFFACCLFNLVASSVLHFKIWDDLRTALFIRIDYAGIFLVIGSSAFPSILYYMKSDLFMVLVSLFHWIIIFAGVFGALIFDFSKTSKSFRSIIYPFFGVPYVYLAYKFLLDGKYYSILMSILTAAFYITGSVFYATGTPNLIPGIFESHELFHLFCWLAFMASFFLNYDLTRLTNLYRLTHDWPRIRAFKDEGSYFLGLKGKKLAPEFKYAYAVLYSISIVGSIIIAWYHNKVWDLKQRALFRRVDYAFIFLSVVSPWFPAHVYYIKDWFTASVVLVHWVLAITGALASLIYDFSLAPKSVRVVFFNICGQLNWHAAYRMYTSGRIREFYYFVIGTTLYFLSGLVYAAKYPNPISRIFEHHEVMHLLVVLGNWFAFETNLSLIQ
ncbi:hypothetical protein MACK_002600 [Theileria orientalis]|uniref:Hemolysin III n=1 Tax=Theileria orientalis TaxID=68886 RepID=A0A976MD81_THEOR|nr:hypothetical protein MACK_002600 [Theileria orientalis]